MSQEMTTPRQGGRRERSKQDKRGRIMEAAGDLFAAQGVSGVTTQQIADHADVAVGTLYRYAATKAELLIMVQNQKFTQAIAAGVSASGTSVGSGPVQAVMTLLRPVVVCVREHAENGRMYLHELLFGDPTESHRREGLGHALRLEAAVAGLLQREVRGMATAEAAALAEVITAVMHMSVTATVHLDRGAEEVLSDITRQVATFLGRR